MFALNVLKSARAKTQAIHGCMLLDPSQKQETVHCYFLMQLLNTHSPVQNSLYSSRSSTQHWLTASVSSNTNCLLSMSVH